MELAPSISQVIDLLNNIADDSRVLMKGGKRYTMVQDRVTALRQIYGDKISIETYLIDIAVEVPGGVAVVVKAEIRDKFNVLATGHAKELWNSSYINKTSALEACETSAIGRALAALGIHGGEFASANEMESALAERINTTEKPALAERTTPSPSVIKPTEIKPTTALAAIEFADKQDFKEAMIDAANKSPSKELLHETWRANMSALFDLKDSDEPLYKGIWEVFQKRKAELTG